MKNKFKINRGLKSVLFRFFIIFLIGLILNYIYYGTLSLSYLFIGGVREWFAVLAETINYFQPYNLLYLVINGIFYFYLYRAIIAIVTYIFRTNKN